MWPRIGSVETYMVFYLAGMVAHLVIGLIIARRWRLPKYVPILLTLAYVLAMTVGAKALYDLQQGQFRFTALLSIKHYFQGGLWGGPLAYLALAVPMCLLAGRRRLKALDLAAAALPVPLILSKIACLCNGCCYGRACSWPWGITFPAGRSAPGGVPLHPTQLYEIVVLLVVIAVFLRLDLRRWRGTMLPWFLALYGCGRALTEFWRGDLKERVLLGPLSHSQWLCFAAAAVSIAILVYVAATRRWPCRRPAPG